MKPLSRLALMTFCVAGYALAGHANYTDTMRQLERFKGDVHQEVSRLERYAGCDDGRWRPYFPGICEAIDDYSIERFGK